MANWTKWDGLFKFCGSQHGIDWKVLKAIAMNESSLGTNKAVAIGLADPKNVMGSVSQDGKSWGLTQMTIKTAKDYDMLVTPEKLNMPSYCVDLTARHLSRIMKAFNSTDLRFTEYYVRAYNCGVQGLRNELQGKSLDRSSEYWRRFQQHLLLVNTYFS